MTLSRRGFLGGLAATLAAPAIIRTPGLLMPVKRPLETFEFSVVQTVIPANQLLLSSSVYDELVAITGRAFIPNLYVDIYQANPLLTALVAPKTKRVYYPT